VLIGDFFWVHMLLNCNIDHTLLSGKMTGPQSDSFKSMENNKGGENIPLGLET